VGKHFGVYQEGCDFLLPKNARFLSKVTKNGSQGVFCNFYFTDFTRLFVWQHLAWLLLPLFSVLDSAKQLFPHVPACRLNINIYPTARGEQFLFPVA
jgi:hypothetical protein